MKLWVCSFSSHQAFQCKTFLGVLHCSFSKAAMSWKVAHPLCGLLLLPLFPALNFHQIKWCDSFCQSSIWSGAAAGEAGVLEGGPLGTPVKISSASATLTSSFQTLGQEFSYAPLCCVSKSVGQLRHEPSEPQ